jgi:hypothetical protein
MKRLFTGWLAYLIGVIDRKYMLGMCPNEEWEIEL